MNERLNKNILFANSNMYLNLKVEILFHNIYITIEDTVKTWINTEITDTENITENICIKRSRNLKINQLEDTTISNLRLFIFNCFISQHCFQIVVWKYSRLLLVTANPWLITTNNTQSIIFKTNVCHDVIKITWYPL